MQNYNKKYFEERDRLSNTLAYELVFILKKYGVKKVLDVGAGTGKLVKFLQKNTFEATGIDSAKIAVNKYGMKLGKASNLPFANSAFDAVLGISLIEHLSKNEAKKFVSEAYRVLKKGGLVFLVTPNFASPARILFGKRWFGYLDPTHKVFYTMKMLKNSLESNKFTNIQFTFSAAPHLPFDWPIPKALKSLPLPVQSLVNFLFISTPLAFLRDSIWILAKK